MVVARFDPFHLPRIAQLIQRSNQFNLATRRYNAAQCESFMNDDTGALPIYLALGDKFGDYGIISVIVARIWRRACGSGLRRFPIGWSGAKGAVCAYFPLPMAEFGSALSRTWVPRRLKSASSSASTHSPRRWPA